MPVSLFYACLHGSEVELPRIWGMVWNCDGDMGFLFVLAYQVGLNVVTLRPVLDRTNWQVDSLWSILSTAYLWLGSVDLWIFEVSVKRFYKYSGYFVLSSQPGTTGTATKNMHILCRSSVTETVQWKCWVVDWKIRRKEASPGPPFLWLPQF